MNRLKKYILPIVEEVTQKLGYLLIAVEIRGSGTNPIIEVYVDGKTAITTEDCSLISGEIQDILDSKNIADLKKYRLDVSSPGIDRPLKFIEQFEKHIGREFNVKFNAGENTENIEGKLVAIEGDVLVFEKNNSKLNIKFENIIKAKVKISF